MMITASSSLCLILAILSICFRNGSSVMTCKDVEYLCPDKVYSISCTMPSDVGYHLLSVDKSHCDKVELDFVRSGPVKDVECIDHKKCGKLCGTLERVKPSMIISMNFTANSNFKGAGINCFGQAPSSIYQSTCLVSFAVPPNSPTNVKVSACSSPHLISWSKPVILNGQADLDLKYHVSVKSTANEISEFVVKDEFMFLPHFSSLQGITTYTVCVSTVNCAGRSNSTCTKITLGDRNLLTPPKVTASVLNSTAVEITLNPTANILDVCHDIETNYGKSVECLTGSKLVINTGERTIHNIRARARVGELTGDWSDVQCVLLSAPPAVVFQNYTVSSKSDATTTVTVSVKLHDLSTFVTNCKSFPANKVQVFGGATFVEVQISEDENEKVVALDFSSTGGLLEKITLTGRATNVIGNSPDNSIDILL